jgi:hypothetical protein
VTLVTPVKSGEAVATENSLTFSWQGVANAGSYSYVLKDASGATIKTGTTTSTSINFSGLEANSTYTLEVTAISSDTSAYKDSGTLTLTGTTTAPQPVALATPKVSAQVAARTVVTWDAVDKAEAYIVSYEKNGTAVADTTTATSANVDFLPLNTAVTISVVAINESDELSLDSEAGTTSVTRTRSETGRTVGVWDGTDTKVNVVSYNDGSYTLEGWYGVAGYDLTYFYDADNDWIVTDSWLEGGWNWAATGVDENGLWFATTYTGWSSAYGDMNEGGVWFYAFIDGQYVLYYVYWPAPADEQGEDLGELVKENAVFYYSAKLSEFYADLYKKTQTDGTVLYTFKNFMKNENLQFTLDSNHYMTFTNLNVIEYDGVPYYMWSTDWSESYKLYLTAEEGYYLDYCYFYGAQGYNVLYPEGDPVYSNQKWGMITFNYNRYAEGSDSPESGYEYIYISLD